jgi:hypothetical protein
MFKFHFLDDDIEQNTSFHSNTNTLYYDNLSIFLSAVTCCERYSLVLRTILACAANDFTVSHETNSLPGNKMYVVRLKKFSLQKFFFEH